ncbi:hypothetical protein PIB30_026715 [Stylosanthes scabra]|uniref:Uncharacterized protein n=1 Tax=Stylosanthes scabra TaxID=79078 RepID=A0ABU6TA78_9FABA|nr:hypothetical protein [Stylosanthes scabra]
MEVAVERTGGLVVLSGSFGHSVFRDSRMVNKLLVYVSTCYILKKCSNIRRTARATKGSKKICMIVETEIGRMWSNKALYNRKLLHQSCESHPAPVYNGGGMRIDGRCGGGVARKKGKSVG